MGQNVNDIIIEMFTLIEASWKKKKKWPYSFENCW